MAISWLRWLSAFSIDLVPWSFRRLPSPTVARLTLVLSAASSWLCRLCLCKKFVYALRSSSRLRVRLRLRLGLR